MNQRLLRKALAFPKDPEGVLQYMERAIETQGYDNVRPVLVSLTDMAEHKAHLEKLFLLRQPDWVWYGLKQDFSIIVATVMRDDNSCIVPIAYCDEHTPGRCTFLNVLEPEQLVLDGSPQPDPRNYSVPRYRVRLRGGIYQLCVCGGYAEIVDCGFFAENIIETGGKGFFQKFEAYTVVYSAKTKEEIRAYRTKYGETPWIT